MVNGTFPQPPHSLLKPQRSNPTSFLLPHNFLFVQSLLCQITTTERSSILSTGQTENVKSGSVIENNLITSYSLNCPFLSCNLPLHAGRYSRNKLHVVPGKCTGTCAAFEEILIDRQKSISCWRLVINMNHKGSVSPPVISLALIPHSFRDSSPCRCRTRMNVCHY